MRNRFILLSTVVCIALSMFIFGRGFFSLKEDTLSYDESRVVRGKITRPSVPLTGENSHTEQLEGSLRVFREFDSYASALTGYASAVFRGVASHYGHGDGLHGRCTASGLPMSKYSNGVAHRDLPLGTLVVVERNGRHVLAEVVDRGPGFQDRAVDLSYSMARYLGVGLDPITIYVLYVPKQDEIKLYHREYKQCLRA